MTESSSGVLSNVVEENVYETLNEDNIEVQSLTNNSIMEHLNDEITIQPSNSSSKKSSKHSASMRSSSTSRLGKSPFKRPFESKSVKSNSKQRFQHPPSSPHTSKRRRRDSNSDFEISETRTPADKDEDRIDKLTNRVDRLTQIVEKIATKQSNSTTTLETENRARDYHQDSPYIPATQHQHSSNSSSTTHGEPGELLFSLTEKTRQNKASFCSGLSAGEHLPHKLKLKIWADKYVDFFSILYPDYEGSFSLSMNTASAPSLQLLPKKNRPLTEKEWISAFDDFTAIYCQKYPMLISDVITYGKFVKNLMHKGHNWRMEIL